MQWQRLISDVRLGQEGREPMRRDARTEFKRDYDRLIFSAPFRRMQNKTQVFPLPGSIFVHNRLTHSLEVASVGMSLACDVARELVARHPELVGTPFEEIGTIVSAACLAHDMGNPPFGHSGEKAIQSFFAEGRGSVLRPMLSEGLWQDLLHFEGNANAFRLLTHRFHGRREGGFVMTYATLASIVKYPHSSECAGTHGKFGFFNSERHYFERIAERLGLVRTSPEGAPLSYARHPLVYLVEAADDICYEIMDIEDAHKLRILSYDETLQLLLGFFDGDTRASMLRRMESEGISDDNERVVYLRACAIGLLERECARVFVSHESEILDGTFTGSLMSHVSPTAREAYDRCVDVSVRRIYNSKPVLDVELSGYKIMETLLDTLTEAAVNPGKYHSRQLCKRFSSQYDIHSDSLETRIMAVVDFISGMTDVFALDFYQKMQGIALPIV